MKYTNKEYTRDNARISWILLCMLLFSLTLGVMVCVGAV